MRSDVPFHMTLTLDPSVTPLVKAACEALEEAGLDDALMDLADRLVDGERHLEMRAEPIAGYPGRLVIGLAPFAELLLRSACDIASGPLDSATKATRIDEALGMAGF